MDFIQTTNKQVDKFGAGKHGFSAGNPGTGVLATFLSNDFCDDVMMELINIIEGASLVPAAATRTQVKQAIDVMVRKMAGAICVAGGTANALTGDFTPDVTVLSAGMNVTVRATAANTTATPTFQADATAAKTVVKGANQALSAGDIAGAGHWLQLVYEATLDRWVLLNPASGVSTIGFGQAWQVVTGTRALATVYTNSTDKPILASAGVQATVASSTVSLSWTVGGVAGLSPASVVAGGTPAQTNVNSCVIIPPGATYSLQATQGSLAAWTELR